MRGVSEGGRGLLPHVGGRERRSLTYDVSTFGTTFGTQGGRINVNVATVEKTGTLRLRVWERGAGLTRACGTGACAVMVATRSAAWRVTPATCGVRMKFGRSRSSSGFPSFGGSFVSRASFA